MLLYLKTPLHVAVITYEIICARSKHQQKKAKNATPINAMQKQRIRCASSPVGPEASPAGALDTTVHSWGHLSRLELYVNQAQL
jgi:hypothetical protein